MSILEMSGDRHDSVFIATPTHICKRYCASRFLAAVDRYACGATHFIVDNSNHKLIDTYYPSKKDRVVSKIAINSESSKHSIHERIVGSMNYCLGFFIDSKREWFLSLESDVIIGESTLTDLIKTSTLNSAPVVHSNCYPGFNKSTAITETDRLTLGCTMIHRSVFDKVQKFRFDINVLAAFHDAFFAIDCKASGIKMLYHPLIKVAHIHASNGSRGWEELPETERQ